MQHDVSAHARIQRPLALATAMLIGAFAITGCGGGGSAGGAGAFSSIPVEPIITTRGISGSVAGLSGNLVFRYGDLTQTISDGAFSIPRAFEVDDSFTIGINSDPIGQLCNISTETSFTDQQVDITGVAITCVAQNLVRVSVENFFTGSDIPDVPIRAIWQENGQPQEFTGTTNSNGELNFEAPTFDGRIIVNADIEGMGEQSVIVTNTSTPANRLARMLFLPNSTTATFLNADGVNLVVAGETLASIPQNSIIDENGILYGGEIVAELTVIDPTQDTRLMPGDYLTQAVNSTIAPIESFGAMSVTFTGAAGEVLNLQPTQTVQLNIPVADASIVAGSPASVPLYHYDDELGYWIEEGTATFRTLTSTGMRVYTGNVNHFTTWNADATYNSVAITGCVVDPNGQPFGNVRIDATGDDYLGAARAISDVNGNFTVNVKASSRTFVTAGDGLQSGTATVVSGTGAGSITECLVAAPASSTITLTWGDAPSDLDSHLYAFSNDDAGDDFHIYFVSKTNTVNGVTVALDVDDVSSFGPEVITIPDFPFSGSYRYVVHHFTGTGDIQASPARVEVNLGGDVTVFTPPGGTPTRCWAVFDIVVDDSGFAFVATVNSWEDETFCTTGNFPNPTGNSAPAVSSNAAGTPNPLGDLIQQKFYR